jgi:hypothetical protein
MKTSFHLAAVAVAGGLAIAAGLGGAQSAPGGESMTMHAKGPFDVKVAPLAQDSYDGGTTLGRFSLEKKLHGDLEGSSKGEMLTAGTAVEGSAGYVAIERVEGALGGRRGSFVLQHLGAMSGAGQQLTIEVVPDSGTGELVGLEGTMRILIEPDGKHFYELDYSLPERP